MSKMVYAKRQDEMNEEFLEARESLGSKPLLSVLGAEARNSPKIKRKGGEKE
jgi:hypothetical protein